MTTSFGDYEVVRIWNATTGDYVNRINGDWLLNSENLSASYVKENDPHVKLQFNAQSFLWEIKIDTETEPIAYLPGLPNTWLSQYAKCRYSWSIRFGKFTSMESFIPQRDITVLVVESDNASLAGIVSPLITSFKSQYALSDHLGLFAITGARGTYEHILNSTWKKCSELEWNDCPVYEMSPSEENSHGKTAGSYYIEYSAQTNHWLLHDQGSLSNNAFAFAALACPTGHPGMPIHLTATKHSQWRMIDRLHCRWESQTKTEINFGEKYFALIEQQVANKREAEANIPMNLRVSGVIGSSAKEVNGVFVPAPNTVGLYMKKGRGASNTIIEFSPQQQQWVWKSQRGASGCLAYVVSTEMSLRYEFRDIVPAPMSLHRLTPHNSLMVFNGSDFTSQNDVKIEHGHGIELPQNGPICCCLCLEIVCYPCIVIANVGDCLERSGCCLAFDCLRCICRFCD